MRSPTVADDAWGGLGRSIRLWRAFRVERTDPDRFYRAQARDSVAQVSRYLDVAGRLVLDVGGGAGYFAEAFVGAGARAVLVEPGAGDQSGRDGSAHAAAVRPGRLAAGRTVAGDGYRLPIRTGCGDLVLSSNVLEHVPDAPGMISELVRVARPGGLVYLSFTTWYSLHGGHETFPWHFLGGEFAARRYERRHGRPPANRFGQTMFACHAGPVLRHVRNRPDVEVVQAFPRYHPRWLHWVVRVPGLREVATWNLLVVLRRLPETVPSEVPPSEASPSERVRP
ncbi:MAG: class I SAM-dependent methyltransferase [Acidimicrobiales bacterium]